MNSNQPVEYNSRYGQPVMYNNVPPERHSTPGSRYGNEQPGAFNEMNVYNATVYNPPQSAMMPPPGPLPPKAEVYEPEEVPRPTRFVRQTRLECVPAYLYSPWAILRYFQWVIGFLVLCLFTVTCNGGKRGACVVYLNEFGRVAEGLGYNAFASMLVLLMTAAVFVLYAINLHRAMPGITFAVEKGVYAFSILLLFIEAILMSMYASWAADETYLYDLARQKFGGIQPAWISAAVLSWINLLLFVGDLVGQCALGYPTVRHVHS